MGVARTPTLIEESVGDMKLYWTSEMADVDDGDTFATGMTNRIVAAWFDPTDDPTTQASNAVDVNYVYATGAITFQTGEDNRTGKLYILTLS
jgi:hypothetical protein